MTNAGYVHEKAVAILERALYGAYASGPRERGVGSSPVYARLHPRQEEFSGDLAADVAQVKIPTEWDSVGGIVPDLILSGADGIPRRIIEVIDTSPQPRKSERSSTQSSSAALMSLRLKSTPRTTCSAY